LRTAASRNAHGSVQAEAVEVGPTRFFGEAPAAAPLRIALLGLGTVGGGVWQLARDLAGEIEVVAVCARDAERAKALGVPAGCSTEDPLAVAASGADVVVECLGGLEPARTAVARALAAGCSVVTANKLLLAEHGAELRALARANGARLLGSASVGGSAPVLERIAVRRRRGGNAIRAVRAVLNGTANFVLEELAAGRDLEAALAAAAAAGLVERGADGVGRRDLDGRDAADKLRVLAAALGAADPVVEREPFAADTPPRARGAAAAGRRLRQVATLQVDAARGRTAASVQLVEVPAEDPLFDLPGAANAALLVDEAGELEFVHGIGAGRWPTAESALGDLLAIARERSRAAGRLPAVRAR
jgi:homoserine dehydrogenase